MTVLFIVLLHAVPVFIIAVWTKSKFVLILAAVVAAIIGVATGNPSYMAADLIGVAIAFALGISFINHQRPSARLQIEEPPPALEKKKEDSSWFSGIVIVVIVAIFLYNKAFDKPAPPVQVQQQALVPPKQVQPIRPGLPVDQSATYAARGYPNAKQKHVARQREEERVQREEEIAKATLQDLRENCKLPECRIVN